MSISAYIGLGSNLGDRAGNLLLGVRGLVQSDLPIFRLSRIYETEPVETLPQPDFLNMVCEIRADTLPAPEEILSILMKIESELGRTREISRGPRLIDLDLLLYGDQVRDSTHLQLPHPRLHQRRFVLEPLAELAPSLIHPTLSKPIEQLLASLDDDSAVKLWQTK
jgi:2-amino-4-hydroxy-6-hydroxymethyldihydropteridine diphosphokinase